MGGVIRKFLQRRFFPLAIFSFFLIFTSIIFVGCGTATKQVQDREPSAPAITPSSPSSVFYLTVRVTAGDPTFRLPIHDNTVNDLYIDWGDGTTEHYTDVPTKNKGILKTYAQAGDYIIALGGHTYFTGTYNSMNGGALGFGFGEWWFESNRYDDETNKQKLIGISGNVSALLGTHKPRDNAYIGYATFYGCSNLTGSIPAELFDSISGVPAEYMFANTFLNCSKLTGLDQNFKFGSFTGDAAPFMFSTTFYGCSNLTGSIPAGLFGDFTGDAALRMFYRTFYGCSNLTGSIPAGLFGNFTGDATIGMFESTFYGCSNLTGSIPVGLFGNFTGKAAGNMFAETFYECTNLTGSIPVGLFGSMNNSSSAVYFFVRTFYNCNNLTGESATMSDGITKLYDAFPGARAFDVGGCYAGATGLDDYDSIPSAWKE